jgi:hypothetical protein
MLVDIAFHCLRNNDKKVVCICSEQKRIISNIFNLCLVVFMDSEYANNWEMTGVLAETLGKNLFSDSICYTAYYASASWEVNRFNL